MNSSSRYFTW